MKVIGAVSLVLSLVQLSFAQNITTIHTDNGLSRGDWGLEEYCPVGSYAASMEVKNQERGNVDDTCINALKLYCYDENDSFTSYITSKEGKFGSWQGIKSCPNSEYIIGYALNLEGEVGNFDDDLGVMDIRVECEGGAILDGLTSTQPRKTKESAEEVVLVQNGVERKAYKALRHTLTEEERAAYMKRRGLTPKEGELGIWGSLATCPIGTFVCGLQSRVENENLVTDDAGLCDLVLFCCD